MLVINVGGQEFFDEKTQTFCYTEPATLLLEHSLLSLSKWESKHMKPFLSGPKKTTEETFDYIHCMSLTAVEDPSVFSRLNDEVLRKVNDHIESPETATTFGEMPKRKASGEVITSELIYYWMVAFNIPFECETWHLNRLFALIRICNIKQEKPKKMSRHEIAQRNRDLNAQRRAAMGTTG